MEGGISAVPGVRAWGLRERKYGVALIACSGRAAGVFTTNKIRAAPLELNAKNLGGGWLDGVIANSGCANAYTGERGLEDAAKMAGILASLLGTDRSRIGVASTGVIGRYLDLGLLERLAREAFPRMESSPRASVEATRAIMTTDTVVKETAVEHRGFRIGGICKGAGMIAPHMATMLAFLYTDADLSREDLQDCLQEAVEDSFNMLIVDGDTSTNDMALITATGKVPARKEDFLEALKHVCTDLARKMARDGEGATRYMEVLVRGARNEEDARMAARAVAGSSLVKTAVYGADPNWGRIVAAAGRSGAEVAPERINLEISNPGEGGSVSLVEKGKIVDGVLGRAQEIMKGQSILIDLDLGLGSGRARSFGCDLTHGYVDINANYTT
ncbi:MAG: bifunctional ornithine acetyltransferase/N-acetylglutamate synthase [Methanosarcinales archaeon]|nr:bifunctional ornithine acetyltransferase/N-acetylglutamate synthase [Methanosarcinales archaeon]